MSITEKLSKETLENFTNIVGESILPLIATVRTQYVDNSMEHSGTGLMISDGMFKYLLTAEHVLNPKKRNPPYHKKFKIHYHAVGPALGSERKRVEPFALRGKYSRCDIDLALVESVLSNRPNFDERQDFFSLEKMTEINKFDAFADDLFVATGVPNQKIITIYPTQEVKQNMHLSYFLGTHTDIDPDNEYLYRFRYDGHIHDPRGLSGSPVWLLRELNNPNKPINLEYLDRKAGKIDVATEFCGIVTTYHNETKQISAVRREYCSMFIREAIKLMPEFRSKEEDEWIENQLTNQGVSQLEKPT